MYHIASNHPFSDGNKRMAILLAELILNNQGFKLKANPRGHKAPFKDSKWKSRS
jgi:prophage maintenance system killer protein